MSTRFLLLEDGATFSGEAFGADADASGEVVFNTGLTGYQEVLTDPSYDGQIVTMTYPHIGNYGTNSEDVESTRPRVTGFVVRDVPGKWSSWRGVLGVHEYLVENGIPGITEVDTRRLTRHIRSRGAMRGAIVSAATAEALERIRSIPEMTGADLVRNVTTAEPYEWPAEGKTALRVAAIDFGIKLNILRMLAERGCAVMVFPAQTPASEILAGSPDGVFLSNGPGDPSAVAYGIETIKSLIGVVPVFGICLGHQLAALALGLSTYKLKFGHRGVNHPVLNLSEGTVEITTQNHGFAVEESAFGFTAPKRPGEPVGGPHFARTPRGTLELTHVNLNDYTVEGFRLKEEPLFCVQYHPEAGPGPHDSRYLFDNFIDMLQSR